MATWVLETKRKILNLFSQRKIQSLDFLMNLLNAYNEKPLAYLLCFSSW